MLDEVWCVVVVCGALHYGRTVILYEEGIALLLVMGCAAQGQDWEIDEQGCFESAVGSCCDGSVHV